MSKLFILLALCFAAGLHAHINVLALSGSTRDDSFNKKLLQEAAQFAKQAQATVTMVNLRDYPMPLYDGDLEAKDGMPSNALKLHNLMAQSDLIMIASPEYNGSLSAVLKNSIDWVTRSKLHGISGEAIKGKRFLLLSASPGGRGGAGSLVHLRSILEHLGGSVWQNQLSLPNANSQFDAQGNLKDETTKGQLKALVQAALATH